MSKDRFSVILDTDIGTDCDDVGAIALLNILERQGETKVLAMTSTTSHPLAPYCISIINDYFGGRDIPVGRLMEPGFKDQKEYDNYTTLLYKEFYRRINNPAIENALTLTRRALAASPDQSIKIIAIGPLRNLSILLDSEPDGISPFTGNELIGRKVKEVCVMGGAFDSERMAKLYGIDMKAEYNIANDIASAQNFIHHCPVPIVFSDYYIGAFVKTGGRQVKAGNLKNPLTFAYKAFCNGARESWDPLTVLYAVRGADKYWALSEPGTVTVHDDGFTAFTQNPDGKHRYLKMLMSAGQIEPVIDDLLSTVE